MVSDSIQALKKAAGEYAVQFVESGMVVGLGHGSTAIWAVRKLAEHLKTGVLSNIVAIPCSFEVENEAKALGILLTNFDQHPVIDVTIDGADEVDPNLQLIKGGGGALLREKIVAQATRRQIIVTDESKLSAALGTKFALPVEMVPFGWRSQTQHLEALGAKWTLRRGANGEIMKTDEENYILDCKFPPMENPHELGLRLDSLATIVEHGLFLNLATDLIIARPNGIEHITRS